MVSRFLNRYTALVVDHPKIVLLIIALLLVGLAAGLPRFKLDASADSLTLEHDRDLDYFRQVSKRYGTGDFLVVTYDPKAELFSDEALTTLKSLRDDLAAVDGVAGVNSILDVPLIYAPNLSLTEVAKGPPTLEEGTVDRAKARREFLNSPIYQNLILGPDAEVTAIQLNLEVDEHYIDLVRKRDELRLKRDREGLTDAEEEQLEQVSETFRRYRTKADQRSRDRVAAVRAVTEKYQDKAEIFVGGVSMIAADMIRFIRKDLVMFGSAVGLFMLAILAIIFRSVRFVLIPAAVCVCAVTMMLGLISWLDWRLTVISSNFVALLLIIALAITIHLVVRYREYAAEYPAWTQRQLVVETLYFMARPCLYTALTTIVAFASLVVSDIRPVIDFGWMMTMGLVLALALAFSLLPAALMLLPREDASTVAHTESDDKKPLTAYCAEFVERHGRWVTVLSVVVAMLGAWGVSRLQVENRFIDYFHEDTEIHQGLLAIDRHLGGTVSLDIIVNAAPEDLAGLSYPDEKDPFADAGPYGGSDPFGTPEREEDPFAEADPFSEHGEQGPSYWMTRAGMEEIQSLHDWLDAQPEIGKVQSLATLYKVGQDLNGSLNDFELALMAKSLPDNVASVLVEPYLSREHNQTRITMRVIDSYPGLDRDALVERIREHIGESGNFTLDQVRISGLLVLYNNMLQSLFSSQIATLGAVFVGITLMFVVLFRSLKLAVIAIVPNALAATAVLGFMGLAGLPLDMMTITVAAITVGIGVDDTIHYIHRFKREFSADGNYLATMHRSHRSIGRAMYYTSVIIIFGFSIMVLSAFIPTIYFGLLTGLAMAMALTGALFLLPKLLLMVKPFGRA